MILYSDNILNISFHEVILSVGSLSVSILNFIFESSSLEKNLLKAPKAIALHYLEN
jgi:hypothetical protein